MKELSIEEKAARYDEALKVLHKYDGANIMFSQSLKEEMFPELKESEDEKIRKELLSVVNDLILPDEQQSRFVAWLEKQGEHKKFRDSIQVGDKVTRNEDGILINLSQLNRVAKPVEKQAEQNYKIIKGKNYFCIKTHNYAGVEWVKGTKYYASDNYTLVNKGCEYYCPEYSKEEHNNLFKELSVMAVEKQGEQKFFINDKVVHKATGKIWTIHHYLKDTNSYYVEDNDGLWHHYRESELKLVEQKPWSEEDEKMLTTIVDYIISDNVLVSKYIDFLKSLKDRVQPQPKQEWNDEDEKYLNIIKTIINSSGIQGIYDYHKVNRTDVGKWFDKSLRPQSQWKPNDEQLDALETAVSQCQNTALESLYEDIRKLKY